MPGFPSMHVCTAGRLVQRLANSFQHAFLECRQPRAAPCQFFPASFGALQAALRSRADLMCRLNACSLVMMQPCRCRSPCKPSV